MTGKKAWVGIYNETINIYTGLYIYNVQTKQIKHDRSKKGACVRGGDCLL